MGTLRFDIKPEAIYPRFVRWEDIRPGSGGYDAARLWGSYAMISLPLDYEVRLQRPDGRLSIRMFMQAAGDAEAKARASEMLRGGVSYASLWRDGKFVDSFYLPQLTRLVTPIGVE